MSELLTPELVKRLKGAPRDVQLRAAEILSEIEGAKKKEHAQNSFMGFVNHMWPAFIEGRHHKIMAEAFEKIASGELKRLIINMPPRHTKSEFASYLLPAWFLGQYPEKKVIQTAHTAELSVGFGRKVRNLVDSEDFKQVFPELQLRADSKAAGRWSTNRNGEYFAIGVGGAVTGKGADLLIIDDPHSEQEGQSGDPSVFDRTYDWYTSGPRQRLQPGGAIVIVMCMTGETPVLRPDGTETRLDCLQPGDEVATWEDGKLSVSRINNWQSSGVDSVYKITTQSGRILRANERHPFLVNERGDLRWVRLKELKKGDLLVSLRDAKDHLGRRQSEVSAAPVRQQTLTTGKTPDVLAKAPDTTESGRALPARSMDAQETCHPEGIAQSIMASIFRRLSHRQSRTGPDALSIVTASLLSSTSKWWSSATTAVMSAVRNLAPQTPALIGQGSSALITATRREKLEGCYAMIATSPSATESDLKSSTEPQFTCDAIASISYDGEEEVFDVEVDQTENFIANGVVSHNTRWHMRDLTGKIIKSSTQRSGTDEWEVIEFPAIMPSGKPLWPEFWSIEELEALRSELPSSKWNAQYQQNPTAEEGALIKREWWKIWEHDRPPPCEFIIQSWDTAFLKTQRSDFSACTTWGVFYTPDDEGVTKPNIILLDAYKERLEFPELKKKAFELWSDMQPDAFIVEAKAAGMPLIFELRAMGIPVAEYTPSRGNDKIARVNAVADLFASGVVWAPETRFAEEVMEEFAAFPAGEHDDLVDSSTQALLRFRQGGFVGLHTDEEEEPINYARRGDYY